MLKKKKAEQEKWPSLLVTKGTETSLIDLRPCFSLLPNTMKVQQSITLPEAKFSFRPLRLIFLFCGVINRLRLLHTSLVKSNRLKMGITRNLQASCFFFIIQCLGWNSFAGVTSGPCVFKQNTRLGHCGRSQVSFEPSVVLFIAVDRRTSRKHLELPN